MAERFANKYPLSLGLVLMSLTACQPASSPPAGPVTPAPVISPSPTASPLPLPSPTLPPSPTPLPSASTTPSPEPTPVPSASATPSPEPMPTPVPSTSVLPEIQFARIKTIAGIAESGVGENGARTDETPLPENVSALEIDQTGNIWILDRSNGRLVYITPEITRPTTSANSVPNYRLFWVRKTGLDTPSGMALDQKNGFFYIVEQFAHRVIKVNTQDFSHTVVAGNGLQGFSGDGPATQQRLNQPTDIALGPDGSLYISDTGNHLIRKITPAGELKTLAGQYVLDTKVEDTNGDGKLDDEVPSYLPLGETSGDGGAATEARLNAPTSIAVDAAGAVYFASKSNTIRRIQNGRIERYAGSGEQGYNGDNYDALLAHFNQPLALTLGPDGLLYFIDNLNHRIRRIRANGFIEDVAGSGQTLEYVSALTNLSRIEIDPIVMNFDTQGNLYLYDKTHFRLRMAEIQN